MSSIQCNDELSKLCARLTLGNFFSDMVPLQETTPENYKVIIFRLISDDFDHIHFNDVIKAFFMVADVRLITPDAKTLTDGKYV